MNEKRTHYPGYDVLVAQDEWDAHTREIILARLGPFPKPQFFSPGEEALIRVMAMHLVYDERQEILDFVVSHLDRSLAAAIGEGQRSPEAPPAGELVRRGLKAVDNLAQKQFQTKFLELDTQKQVELLASLQQGLAPEIPDWKKVPQKELFKKLAEEIVSAYYSHPTVWSEIGYPGPAYPRGYVRIERGLTDPWEAKRNGKEK
ncbi:MAG TPA: gluconate 2-dehydrogenase subunit 3 family protein [Clostridia bacterium]|nr:gluconate 2-dehydrogenase subunit 3 family protein [Clostridia bacterium]